MAGNDLHWDGTRWLQWDGSAWVPLEGQSPPPPAGPPPPASSDDRRDPWRVLALVLAAVVLLALGIGGGIWWASRSSTTATPAASASASTSAVPAPTTVGSDVLAEPVNTSVDPFTEKPNDDVTGLMPEPFPAQVTGSLTGLYGGTLDETSCDRERLVAFLTANPDKARAWASVPGIDPADIGDYVWRLTPVVLRSDTRVVNHGYRDGRVTTFNSVLQAGSAVLVDDYGVPAVRCYCGNPLSPATDLTDPVYVGPTWSTFSGTSVTVVVVSTTVIGSFVLVDVVTGDTFTRPPGTGGDADVPEGAVPGGTTPGGTVPEGEEELIYSIGSILGVRENPPRRAAFGVEQGLYVTRIMTYHYNNNGTPPGTIGLRASDGTVYGPWPAEGSEGQGGVANAYWTAYPDTEIPPGRYTIVDSDPSTWSWADDTNGRGITEVYGIWTVQY